MQCIIPKDDTSALSLPERAFLRAAARGEVSSSSSLLRLDGRSPCEHRPTRLSFSRCHNRSECVVRLASGTRTAASVHAELCPPPNADRPNDGQVRFGVDVGPMGCPGREAVDRPASNFAGADGGETVGGGGGGGEAPYAQRLKSNRILRVLERTLLVGGAMDAEALCVRSGAWVWRLRIDVGLLDDGGNAVDACVLAAVAAMRHYRLPEVSFGDDGDGGEDSSCEATVVHSDDREPSPLPLHHTPLTATFALFADASGASSSVSALLDPSDREELACDGLLTWSYNRHGEMCCLDFPGGCELRPRQLMASANLGKRRCVEACEMLEKALEEADGKAQQDRMERLKALNANLLSVTEDVKLASPSPDDVCQLLERADDRMEEEDEYRLRALDYSWHFAASVKEDGRKKASKGKGIGVRESSSLFNAILRSAHSVAIDEPPNEGGAVVVSNSDGEKREQSEKGMDMKILSQAGKPHDTPGYETGQVEQEGKTTPSKTLSTSDSDEEKVDQLQSEFEVNENPPIESSGSSTLMLGDSKIKPVEKVTEKVCNSKNSGEDITDLAQALKKKKKSKKSKKK